MWVTAAHHINPCPCRRIIASTPPSDLHKKDGDHDAKYSAPEYAKYDSAGFLPGPNPETPCIWKELRVYDHAENRAMRRE